MKLSLLLFPLAVFAQRVAIGLPTQGDVFIAGSDLLVEIDRPNTLSGSTEVAIVIGVTSCASAPCVPAQDIIGIVLYNGPYNPVFLNGPKPPHQNFTVTLPSGLASGPAQLNVAHVSLIGAGRSAFLETLNRSIVVN